MKICHSTINYYFVVILKEDTSLYNINISDFCNMMVNIELNFLQKKIKLSSIQSFAKRKFFLTQSDL